jgi:hypothetical protein
VAELRDKVIAPCSIDDPETGTLIGGDPGALLLRMILFEENIIDSTYLKELPYFIESLGVEQVILLLNEGNIRIKCDSRTLGDYGGKQAFPKPRRGDLWTLGTYKIDLGWNVDPGRWFRGATSDLLAGLRLPDKTADQLESAVTEHSAMLPPDFGRAAIAQFARDVENGNHEIFRRSLSHVLEVELGLAAADADKVKVEVEPTGGGACNVATNLDSLRVPWGQQYDLVRTALFGVGSLYMRLEEMRSLQAISGFQPAEMPLFDSKVDLLADQILPETQDRRFRRVVSIIGLPDFSEAIRAGQKINLEPILKMRNSADSQQFRAWLRTLDEATEEEIRDQVASLRAKAAKIAESAPGRIIRFGTVTGAGFIPVVGLPLGIGLGAIDSFVVDRLLGEPGPVAFLSRHYKSIFD